MTDEKSLKLLEFDKIAARLAEHAETDGGRARCLALRPTDDIVTAQEWLDFTEAALHLYNLKGTFTMTHLPDMADLFSRIRVSGLLSAQELYGVARVLDAARRLRAYRGDEATALDDYFERTGPASGDRQTAILSGEQQEQLAVFSVVIGAKHDRVSFYVHLFRFPIFVSRPACRTDNPPRGRSSQTASTGLFPSYSPRLYCLHKRGKKTR